MLKDNFAPKNEKKKKKKVCGAAGCADRCLGRPRQHHQRKGKDVAKDMRPYF